MTEIERIVDQLNRAFEGEAWHGPAVMDILEGITAQQAAARLSMAHIAFGKSCFTSQPGSGLSQKVGS